MKQVILTPGTKINLSDELNTLQTFAYDNAYSLFDLFIENEGVLCDTISGIIDPADTSLQVVFSSAPLKIMLRPGIGLTASGIVLFRDTDLGTSSSITAAGAGVVNYIYAAYTDTLTDTVPKIVGFVYNPSGTTTAYTRNEATASTNIAFRATTSLTEATTSGILLASGLYSGATWTWTADARTPLRIKSDLLPAEVFRKYGEFSNIGSISTTKLGIQSNDETYTLWLDNTGVTADYTMQASGLQYAYDYRHAAGSETTFTESGLTAGGHLILTDYNAISKGTGYSSTTNTPKASQELTRLFRHGIINFDGRTDGVNDQRVVTTLIPSKPGTPTNVSGQLIELSTDSKFSSELNAAMLNYNLKDLQVTRKNEGVALATAFYGEVQRVAAENNYSTMSGLYTYSGVVYLGTQTYASPQYPKTLTAAATGIVNAGYDINMSGLGWALASGANYYDATTDCFVYQINTTVQSMNNQAVSLERDRLQAATSVLSKTNRLELAPAHARKQYRCRVTWTAPSEVNNEQIKNYNVRIYKLNPTTQNAVATTPTIPTLEADFGKIIELKDQDTYLRRKEYQTVSGHASISWTGLLSESGYETTVVYPTSAGTWGAVRVGDYVVQSNGTDIGSPYFVTKFINTSGLQLDRKFTYSGIGTYNKISIYRSALESTTTHIKLDFDIYADQYYVIYVRAVTEYEIAGDWSTALRISTNELTNTAGNTLANIVNTDEMQIARTNEIKNTVFTQKLNSQIVALQKTVEDTPPRTAFDSLVVRVNELSA